MLLVDEPLRQAAELFGSKVGKVRVEVSEKQVI
jgi:hypothetical protein